jgi:hypothetical protein
VTESEWLICTSPEPMLEFLKGKASDRKFRLFACACCRRIWHLLDGWTQNLVDVSERHIEGLTCDLAMTFAVALHADVIQRVKPYTPAHIAAGIASTIPVGAAWPLAWNVVSEVRRAIRHSLRGNTCQEAADQAGLVREIFGNPFRSPFYDSSWKTCGVVTLARVISANPGFDRMPILANALEEAGCTDTDMLEHCRGPGPHARGCWAVDRILARE